MTDAQKAEKMERLSAALETVDFTCADGRAGINALLREIEAVSPGALERMTAGIQLRRLGCRSLPQ